MNCVSMEYCLFFSTFFFQLFFFLNFFFTNHKIAILINSVSIYTLSYDSPNINATVVQYTPPLLLDLDLTTPVVQDVLTYIQVVSASYLLLGKLLFLCV